MLAVVNMATSSGFAFFRAAVSSRWLVTAFQVIFQSLPVSVSVQRSVISALIVSWMPSICAYSSSAFRFSSRSSLTLVSISLMLIVVSSC